MPQPKTDGDRVHEAAPPETKAKKRWVAPAIVQGDILETIAGACNPGTAKATPATCTDQSLS